MERKNRNSEALMKDWIIILTLTFVLCIFSFITSRVKKFRLRWNLFAILCALVGACAIFVAYVALTSGDKIIACALIVIGGLFFWWMRMSFEEAENPHKKNGDEL